MCIYNNIQTYNLYTCVCQLLLVYHQITIMNNNYHIMVLKVFDSLSETNYQDIPLEECLLCKAQQYTNINNIMYPNALEQL